MYLYLLTNGGVDMKLWWGRGSGSGNTVKETVYKIMYLKCKQKISYEVGRGADWMG